MIRLTTIGTTDLRNASGDPVDSVLRQPRRFALLVYLALESRAGYVRRDRILSIFWPEVTTEQGRSSLSQALHWLRKSLGVSAVQARGQDELQLDLDYVACDACAFLDAAEADPESASRLFTGEFLPGFNCSGVPDFDAWLDQTRAELRRTAADAAWAAAERAAARHEWVTAAALARRAAEMGGEEEAQVRRLMSFLAALGDRAGALDAYDSLARHLEREYAAEPAAPTRQLAAEIRDQEQATSLPREPLPVLAQPAPAALAGEPASAPAPALPAAAVTAATAAEARGWRALLQRYDRVRSVVVTTVLTLAFIGVWGLSSADQPVADLLAADASLLVEETRGSTELADALTAEVVRELSHVDQLDVLLPGMAREPRTVRDGSAELALRTTVTGSGGALEATVLVVDRLTGKTVASERLRGTADGTLSGLSARIAGFARRTVGSELERRRAELANVGDDVLLDLRDVRKRLQTADSLSRAGFREVARVQLSSTDSQLASIEERAPRWTVPALERAELSLQRMWAHMLPPQADPALARAAAEQGVRHADRAIRLDPADARGYEVRGVLNYLLWGTAPADLMAGSGDLLARALTDLEQATHLASDASRAWNYLSTIHFHQGEFAKAYVAANNALATDQFLEHTAGNHTRIFWSALEIGDVISAERWCREMQDFNSASSQAAYCQLVLAAWPGSAPMASERIQQLVEQALQPRDADPGRINAAHAVVLARSGNTRQARELLREVRELGRRDPQLLAEAAWVYHTIGEHETASALLDTVLQNLPRPMHGAVTKSVRFGSYRASNTAATRTIAVK